MAVTKAVLSHLVVLALLVLAGPASAQRSTASGYAEERINQMQQTVADLTRRLQDLQRQNQQLQQQMEKMQSSYEQRIERLEKGTAVKAPAVRRGKAKP